MDLTSVCQNGHQQFPVDYLEAKYGKDQSFLHNHQGIVEVFKTSQLTQKLQSPYNESTKGY